MTVSLCPGGGKANIGQGACPRASPAAAKLPRSSSRRVARPDSFLSRIEMGWGFGFMSMRLCRYGNILATSPARAVRRGEIRLSRLANDARDKCGILTGCSARCNETFFWNKAEISSRNTMTGRMANCRWASGRYPWHQICRRLGLRTWGKTSAIAGSRTPQPTSTVPGSKIAYNAAAAASNRSISHRAEPGKAGARFVVCSVVVGPRPGSWHTG